LLFNWITIGQLKSTVYPADYYWHQTRMTDEDHKKKLRLVVRAEIRTRDFRNAGNKRHCLSRLFYSSVLSTADLFPIRLPNFQGSKSQSRTVVLVSVYPSPNQSTQQTVSVRLARRSVLTRLTAHNDSGYL